MYVRKEPYTNFAVCIKNSEKRHVSKLFNIPILALEHNDNIHFSTLKT